jgi:hypothetical protein
MSVVNILKNLGWILLGIWLVFRGLFALIDASFTGLNLVLDILAIAAGLLILFGLRSRSLSNPRNLGDLLLGIWLLLSALLSLLNASFAGAGLVLDILAIAAGALILYTAVRSNPLGNLGRLLLGIWLLLMGLLSLLSLGFGGSGAVLAVLALAAGILLLVGR